VSQIELTILARGSISQSLGYKDYSHAGFHLQKKIEFNQLFFLSVIYNYFCRNIKIMFPFTKRVDRIDGNLPKVL